MGAGLIKINGGKDFTACDKLDCIHRADEADSQMYDPKCTTCDFFNKNAYTPKDQGNVYERR